MECGVCTRALNHKMSLICQKFYESVFLCPPIWAIKINDWHINREFIVISMTFHASFIFSSTWRLFFHMPFWLCTMRLSWFEVIFFFFWFLVCCRDMQKTIETAIHPDACVVSRILFDLYFLHSVISSIRFCCFLRSTQPARMSLSWNLCVSLLLSLFRFFLHIFLASFFIHFFVRWFAWQDLKHPTIIFLFVFFRHFNATNLLLFTSIVSTNFLLRFFLVFSFNGTNRDEMGRSQWQTQCKHYDDWIEGNFVVVVWTEMNENRRRCDCMNENEWMNEWSGRTKALTTFLILSFRHLFLFLN